MRRKISRRKRKEALARGVKIVREEWVREPGWKRKDIGYAVEGEYRGWKLAACGHDELEAFHGLMECLDFCDEDPNEE